MINSSRNTSGRFPVAGILLSLVLLGLLGVSTASAGSINPLWQAPTGAGVPTSQTSFTNYNLFTEFTLSDATNVTITSLGVYTNSLTPSTGSEKIAVFAANEVNYGGGLTAGSTWTLLGTATVLATDPVVDNYYWAPTSINLATGITSQPNGNGKTKIVPEIFAVEVFTGTNPDYFSATAPTGLTGGVTVLGTFKQAGSAGESTLPNPDSGTWSGTNGAKNYFYGPGISIPEGGSSALYLLLAAAACLGALLLNSRARIASPAIA